VDARADLPRPACFFCGESVAEDEDCGAMPGTPAHYECVIRSVIGGYNHLRGRCTCCGGTLPPDPPELSKREAASVAVAYWRLIGKYSLRPK